MQQKPTFVAIASHISPFTCVVCPSSNLHSLPWAATIFPPQTCKALCTFERSIRSNAAAQRNGEETNVKVQKHKLSFLLQVLPPRCSAFFCLRSANSAAETILSRAPRVSVPCESLDEPILHDWDTDFMLKRFCLAATLAQNRQTYVGLCNVLQVHALVHLYITRCR